MRRFSRTNYDGGEEIFETIIMDGTGRKLGKWRVMKRDYPRCVEIISKQYGISFKKTKLDEDLEWGI